MAKKKHKLIGKFVTEKLSGRKAMVVQKKGKNYTIRVWVQENCNWMMMKCPKSQFEKGVSETKKIGFK